MWDKLKQLVEVLERRFSNPFLISYFLSLLAINYRFFVVLASDESYRGKFYYIDAALYPHILPTLRDTVLYPVLVATLYTFVWPKLDGRITVWYARTETKNQNKALEATNTRTYPFDVAEKIISAASKRAADAESRLTAALQGIESVKEQQNAAMTAVLARLHQQSIFRWAGSDENGIPSISYFIASVVGAVEPDSDWQGSIEALRRIKPKVIELRDILEILEAWDTDDRGRAIVRTQDLQSHPAWKFGGTGKHIEMLEAMHLVEGYMPDQFEFRLHDRRRLVVYRWLIEQALSDEPIALNTWPRP